MLAIHSLTDIYLVGRKEKKSWRDVSFFYWTALVKQRSELFSIILRKDHTWSWSRILQWMTFRGSFDLVTNKITQIHLHAELHSHCWKVVSNSRWVLLKECNMKLVVFCSFNTHRCPLSVIDWHLQMQINRRRLKPSISMKNISTFRRKSFNTGFQLKSSQYGNSTTTRSTFPSTLALCNAYLWSSAICRRWRGRLTMHFFFYSESL